MRVRYHVWHLHTFIRYNALHKTDNGYKLVIPLQQESTRVKFTCITLDLGSAVVTLLRNYESHKDEIWNQTFNVMSAEMTYGEFVNKLERGQCIRRVDLPKTFG